MIALPPALFETHFNFPGQTGFYRGKVRDVYFFGKKMVMVVTDRVSAFDHIMPKPIPFKGQILNKIAQTNLEATNHIVPNWLEAVPDPNVSLGKRCSPIPVEMVIRGYLVGHAWREYKAGKRELCGESMQEGMRENEAFPVPIITPATKAESGHDLDISKKEILERGIVSAPVYEQLEQFTHALYRFGKEKAREKGLILVDTKYEFGLFENDIYLIDEVHTPDSSRYFYAEGYEERLKNGERQKQLSKEFLREWLMENGFQGLDGQQIPEITESTQKLISDRYVELYEKLMGSSFKPDVSPDPEDRIRQNLFNYLS